MLPYVPKQWKINNLFTSKVIDKIVDIIEARFNDKYLNAYCYESHDAPYIAFGSINSNMVSGKELTAMCEDGEFITGTLFFQYGTGFIVYNLVKYFYDEDLEYVVMRYATGDNSLSSNKRVITMHISPDTVDGFEVLEVYFD